MEFVGARAKNANRHTRVRATAVVTRADNAAARAVIRVVNTRSAVAGVVPCGWVLVQLLLPAASRIFVPRLQF